MTRSSYFKEIAPTAGPSPSAALAPVPPLFRPGGVPPAFLEVETLNAPPRETVEMRSSAAPPAAHDQAQPPALGTIQATIAGAGRQDQFPPPGRGQRMGRDEIRDAQPINAPSALRPPTTQVAQHAATTATGAVAPRPTSEPEQHRPTLREEAYAASASQSVVPLLTPPVSPPAPAVIKQAPTGSAGVHIGTLEVRVVTPPATPQASPLRPRIPTRAPPLHQARSGARLSRSFGVFGLGQT